jgi:uncharacterized RDD family membrane protein YckC
VLDTVRSVEIPEGVEFRLRVAGPVPRLYAWLIDSILRGLIGSVAAVPLAAFGKSGMGLLFIVYFLVEWFYPVAFEVLRGGATPGKKAMGLVVLEDDGAPVGLTSSVVRNLVRFADFLPFLYGFGLASMLATRDFKRLGDLAAGTIVVHRDDDKAAPRVPAARPLPPAYPLLADEQRAVVEFAERLPTWTEERARELAAIASPLTGTGGREGPARLVGIASWVLGRR